MIETLKPNKTNTSFSFQGSLSTFSSKGKSPEHLLRQSSVVIVAELDPLQLQHRKTVDKTNQCVLKTHILRRFDGTGELVCKFRISGPSRFFTGKNQSTLNKHFTSKLLPSKKIPQLQVPRDTHRYGPPKRAKAQMRNSTGKKNQTYS